MKIQDWSWGHTAEWNSGTVSGHGKYGTRNRTIITERNGRRLWGSERAQAGYLVLGDELGVSEGFLMKENP